MTTSPRTPLLFVAAGALSVGLALASASSAGASAAPQEREITDETVREACSECHAWAPPETLPRDSWRRIISDMNESSLLGHGLGGEMGHLWQYNLHRITRYYVDRAPEVLPPPESWPAPGAAAERFVRHGLVPDVDAAQPGVSNVRFLDMDGDARPELVVTDMRYGAVFLARPAETAQSLELVARIPNPAHTAPVDLDRDGARDLLVADLGGLLPGDHRNGSVVWLRQSAGGRFEKTVLVSGLPRVADVEAADFDRDGDDDLVVAAFGWREVGDARLYELRSGSWAEPVLEPHPVDDRAGTIPVPVADLDGDGLPDLVALVSQQHEKVVAYLNRGPGRGFEAKTLFEAPFPSWGSSGIQLVDFDGDGDLDVLMTNGDSLDDQLVKPYHGIGWLENRGGFPWVRHDLAGLPGVHRAQAADLDGDGDLDVVAAAFLLDPANPDAHADFASLVWLERVGPDAFRRHTLEAGRLLHATLDLADYDLDGDVDIAVGNLGGYSSPEATAALTAGAPWVEIWENRGLGGLPPPPGPDS